MISARAYVAGDARLIDAQPQQLMEARALALNGAAEYDAAAKAGPAYTIVRDDRPAACGGLIAVWSGYALAWGLTGPLDAALARAIARQVKRALGELAGLRRAEATARADYPQAQRFLETLGFARAALLSAYGPDGADYWLYEHLPERVG